MYRRSSNYITLIFDIDSGDTASILPRICVLIIKVNAISGFDGKGLIPRIVYFTAVAEIYVENH